MKENTFFKQAEADWENLGNGISRQISGYNNELMLVKVRFKKGAIGELHHHIHSQASYVVSGQFKITINGQTQILNAGDGFFVTPNLEHGAECLEAGIFIDTFNPVREDFL